MRSECLRDKTTDLFSAGPILIPDVSGICPVTAIPLLSQLGSSGAPTIVESSDVSCVTNKVTVGAIRPIDIGHVSYCPMVT